MWGACFIEFCVFFVVSLEMSLAGGRSHSRKGGVIRDSFITSGQGPPTPPHPQKKTTHTCQESHTQHCFSKSWILSSCSCVVVVVLSQKNKNLFFSLIIKWISLKDGENSNTVQRKLTKQKTQVTQYITNNSIPKQTGHRLAYMTINLHWNPLYCFHRNKDAHFWTQF